MPSPARVVERSGATVLVFGDAGAACRAAADRIAQVARAAIEERGRAVLGLATGASPVAVYSRLVALHKTGELSFRDVTTYNLDEYYPIAPTDPRSYRAYMESHLFGHVDLLPNRAHLLDGTVPEGRLAEYAAQFDRWIETDGGLDLQLLGIGRNGHIGFNEPTDLLLSDALRLSTRLVELDQVTRVDAAKEFGGEHRVIPRALTLGVAQILAARSIVVLALGPHKSGPVAAAIDGPVSARLPGSLLQTVSTKVTWFLDLAAAAGLATAAPVRSL